MRGEAIICGVSGGTLNPFARQRRIRTALAPVLRDVVFNRGRGAENPRSGQFHQSTSLTPRQREIDQKDRAFRRGANTDSCDQHMGQPEILPIFANISLVTGHITKLSEP